MRCLEILERQKVETVPFCPNRQPLAVAKETIGCNSYHARNKDMGVAQKWGVTPRSPQGTDV